MLYENEMVGMGRQVVCKRAVKVSCERPLSKKKCFSMYLLEILKHQLLYNTQPQQLPFEQKRIRPFSLDNF